VINDTAKAMLIMKNIIDSYLDGKYSREQAVEELMYSIDPNIMHCSLALMVTDCYYTIKYLTETGYETTDFELAYFKDCIDGVRTYDVDEKIELARKYISFGN
jgi:hypothetical protein